MRLYSAALSVPACLCAAQVAGSALAAAGALMGEAGFASDAGVPAAAAPAPEADLYGAWLRSAVAAGRSPRR